MLLYAFQGRYGGDKLCWTEQGDFKVGDLLVGNHDMYLVLGATPRNSKSTDHKAQLNTEKSLTPKSKVTEELALHHKGFLSKESIELIRRMVDEYYTSYKNVVKLFVTGELADLFKKEVSVKKKSFFLELSMGTDTHGQSLNAKIAELQEGQQLIVFPDVRTMMNTLEKRGISEKTGIAILNSTSTQQQKDKTRWGIKMGHINTLICTSSQIFQDWKDLRLITLIDSHQRYYKNQQDPRYDTREVMKNMAHMHNATLKITGIQIFA